MTSEFTVAKTWKQSKCPLTEEWVKKMWYLHTVESLLSSNWAVVEDVGHVHKWNGY